MTNWQEKATSLSYDEKQIIQWIIELHNGGQTFQLDPTFSKGVFWRGLEEPELKFDIAPQIEGVKQADCRSLPLEDNSVTSIMFDPPFVTGSRKDGKPGIIKERFSYYKDMDELWTFYNDALKEFHRILTPDGTLAFKCQDVISGGINYFSHAKVMVMAQEKTIIRLSIFAPGLCKKTPAWNELSLRDNLDEFFRNISLASKINSTKNIRNYTAGNIGPSFLAVKCIP